MPVSLSVWRVRIGTFLRRFQYDPKKEAEQSKEDDNANSQNPSSNGSLIDERSNAVSTSCPQPPSSGDVGLKTTKTESPSNISSIKVGVCSETLSTVAIPGCDTVNGSPFDIRSPGNIAQHGSLCADDRIRCSRGKKPIPVYDPSDTKAPEPCDLDDLDMRYITINGVSPISLCDSTRVSEPVQLDGTSESYSHAPSSQHDGKHDEKETSNSLPSGMHGQSSPSSEMDTSSKAKHTSCMREIAGFHGTPISTGSRSRSSSGDADEIQRNLFCSGVTNVLLLRSGDVEQNPGPNANPGSLTELELNLLADGMDPSDFRKVGLALGFTEAQLRRFERDNIGNIMQATYKMLCEWLKTVLPDEARETLSNKLKDTKLVQLADKLQKGQVGDHILSLTEEELKRVIIEVKKYSAIHHCQIQADPLNSELILEFKRIFTNLKLMEEDKGTKDMTPLLYEDLLKTKVNEVFPQRLLVEGEGGVGKTTLCAKIVWDWIHGAGYKEFRLVLLVLLREVKDKTIGEIIMSYLPDDIKVTAMQLNKYVFSHQKDVLLVLDGFDELAGDLDSCYQIALIILNRLFKSGKVLITSRRWRSDEIRKITELRKLYAFIAVEGFSYENLSSYITQFFHPDTTSSKELNRFILNNDVIRENMAPFPIYTAMLCTMWKDFNGERREAMSKLQTFSQLIDEMVLFLIDHHLSKRDTSAGDVCRELDLKRKEILCHLTDIGCLALRGLHERRLVFTEQEFQRWPGSLETGCKVGVLTKQTQTPSRRERRHRSHSAVTSVQFSHKLFQEYLSGKYLAYLHNSDKSKYDNLMKDIIGKAREFRELLYFTSAQQKEVGLDIVSRLAKQLTVDDFIVDVIYESQDQTVAKAVADHLSSSSMKTLEIGFPMQAHTVSGHIFLMNQQQKKRTYEDDNIAGDSGEENSDDGGHDNTISAGHSTVADESRGQLLDSTLKKAIEKQIAHSLRSSSLIKRLADDVYDVIAAKLEEQVVDKVYKAVNLDLKKYMDEVETMEKKMSEMKKETKMLQDENEEAEQYSRRNCLRLYGIPEGPEEKTDELILDVFNSKLGLTVPPDAIDRSHRIFPRPRQGDEQRHESSSYAAASRRNQPRPIIVKLAGTTSGMTSTRRERN
ncbi:uncharacterized protein LOC121413097 [Lytechinus variegatus]|uniref:uncharacterized protein LOC121413097 n=1 Tax=Lytechinus variegatus TaxID=7654 RepID=UPI001BB299A9|nr:uncharacterized protein LOC121413097 [Lytechinus variegatus]